MEDEERQKKLEAGREKLAQYRQRKAHREGQNSEKKKKKFSSCKQDVHSLKINGQNDMSINSSQCIESAGNPDSTKMRALPSGKIEKYDQVFIKGSQTQAMRLEISSSGDWLFPEPSSCYIVFSKQKPTLLREEEEFVVDNSSKQGGQFSRTHLEVMGDELAGKQHEIEELTQELEEMRTTQGTEVLQQLQEFEAAVKQRDNIITQLIANLQQARKDKDETIKEFLDLTEQSKTLHIQFQHLQASEALRRNTHNNTTAELCQVKQQLEKQDHLLKDYHKREEEFKKQITFLQEEIKIYEMDLKQSAVNMCNLLLEKKQAIIEAMNTRIIEEEKKTTVLKNKVITLDKLVEDLKEQLTGKNRETNSLKLELANSKEKEKQCSLEIKQLMETVEELQKKYYKDNLETALVQRREEETQRKLGHLQAELDEMYGKQIVEMKKELIKQHMAQMEELKSQHKGEMEKTLKLCADAAASEEQLKLMNVEINELNIKLQDSVSQKEKLREELRVVKGEKCALQSQFNDLSDEVRFLRGQTHRARQTITEQESKLNDAQKFLSMVEDLKAEITALSESRKELELKHEAEITNYQIKLDMLEKEKDAVLDRMAESQEAELERLRTQLLFSHEEELCKLKDDLEVEHQINIEKLKDNLGIHHKQQIDGLQNEMREKIKTMQFEKDNLITKQNQLILEISKLRDLQESHINSKSEEMAEINELKKEIEILRQEEREKGTFEQGIQELQLKTELLEKQLKAKEEDFQEKCSQLEAENSILKDEKKALEDMLKLYTPTDQERADALDSSEYTSKSCNWQKQIDILTKEKEDLKQQCINLNKEIERQRNTFSFAEKNFEVNYQELREEYACLLKVRDNLEDIQTKQVLEYESKLKMLTEELHLQRGSSKMQEEKHLEFTDGRICITEPLEVSEVIEKDAVEIMEKLRVTEKEKLELSEKLDLLSKQLKQTHAEVDFLTAELRILNQDKEQLLLRCRELEVPISHRGTEDATVHSAQLSCYKAGLVTMADGHSEECDSKVSKDLPEESEVMIEDKISFKEIEPCENEKLQHELNDLKSKQDDLRLQMEAQQICLSLVYSTHTDVVREYMEKKKEEALCSLRDELVSAQQKKIEEINKMHQSRLQILQTQETGGKKEPLQVLIGRLQKAVSEECTYITKTLNSFLDEHYTPLKCEMNIEEKDNCAVYNYNQRLNLQEYTYQVQDFQDNMQTLLSKVKDEFSKLKILQSQLSKIHEQQIDDVKLEFTEEHLAKKEAGCFSITTQADLQNTGAEKIKDCEERGQGLESLVSTVPEHLRDTEMHCGAEVQSWQEGLQTTHEITVQPSLLLDALSYMIIFLNLSKLVYRGSWTWKHIMKCLMFVFPSEFGGRKETNMVKLTDKKYKERLEEEIAKVIVSMSIAFAQQTEFSRLSERKENSIQSEQARGLCWQEHPFNDIMLQDQVGPHTFTGTDKNFKEQFKSLSEELEEHIKEVPLSNHDDLDDDILKSKDHGLTISQEIFSKDETLTLRQYFINDKSLYVPIDDEASITETSRQLEDMRQELVRQYEEHQQATELLRQTHMQQMERQQEDQEQLREEIKRLNAQLAQRSSINTENMVTDREMVLLEELEALKQLSLAGREELCCELQSSSTQTQDEDDNEEVEGHTLKEKTLERKPEEPILDINLSNERHALQKTNNRLLKILLEVAKTTAAAEETIGCHVVGILDRSSKGQPASSLLWRSEADIATKLYDQEEYARGIDFTDEPVPSCPGSAITRNDSKWSKVTEKEAELSQHFETSGCAAPEIDCENVELMFNVSSRLQAAVEKLLGIISETSSQLEHAKVTQSELMHESVRQKQEAVESLRCLEELHERLEEESRAREQLAVELNKAECIIDGYSDEKIIFEREIQEKNLIIDRLEQELLCTSTRLQDLEAEQQQVQEEQELLSRQKAAMRAVAGPVEHQFLQETEKLMKEKLEVQCQAEKVRNGLQKQLKILEIDVEEKTSKLIEMEQEKNAEITDLRQQNQALDKQLEKIRRFIDEQTADREHERDIFQLEIQKLEQQLKVVPRLQPGSEQQTRKVEELTSHLKEKSDKCCELLLCKEQLQRDMQERDEEIENLEGRVRELEQALLLTADPFPKMNDQKKSGGIEVKSELSLEVQLQAERDAIDRKEREISNLEEQLEQFREELENKNDEVQELHMQLEIQRKESTTRLQELQQENNVFKDEMKKLEFVLKEYNPIFTDSQPMLFGKFAQIIQEKDEKIDWLNEQFIKLKQELKLAIDNKDIEEKHELIRGLRTQNECLMIDQEHVKKNREEEIEKLKGVIESLHEELASIKQKTTDVSTLPKDGESLKHQLDKVIAEKMALEQKVETTSEEMAYTKNILEASVKMDQLTEELCTLRKEHENKEELETVPEENVSMTVSELSSDILQPDVPAQDSLKNQTSLRCPKENTDAYRCLETKLLLLESSVSTKDLELTQCYKQIKTMQEQGRSETETLQKKITNLQKLLQEKAAAAIVSQALLEAFQQYVNYYQENQTISSEPERTNRQKVTHLIENSVDSDVSTLTVRMAELESQVAEIHSTFISEKQQVEIGEKAPEKESVLEPQKPLEEKRKEDSKISEYFSVCSLSCLQSKTNAELIFASGDCGFLDELEAFGDQLMSHKELASYKERAEKSEDLLASSIPGLTYSNIHQTNEICSSDSESDLGQGFDTASEGREDGGTGLVPNVVKGLLRAVHTEGIQMLSMAHSPDDDGEDQLEQQISEFWLEERKAYLSTISSLKNLIFKMQLQRQTEVYDQSQSHESLSDWRGELLLALRDVLLKEHNTLLATFRTVLTSLYTRDIDGLLNCLEQKIQEQGIEYQTAMEFLQKADRRSLLAENQALQAKINGREMTGNKEQEMDTSSQEFLDCSMEKSSVCKIQDQPHGMKDTVAELQEQLLSKTVTISELKSELSQTKLELETILKTQRNQLKELEVYRLELKDKTDKVHLLTDTLAVEQKKSQDLQCALETEKAKAGHQEERDKELKSFKVSLEDQKQRNIHLDVLLGQQRQLFNELQQKIESQRMLYDVQLSEEQAQNLKLRVLVECEEDRNQEMKYSFGKEQELSAQLQSGGDGMQPQPVFPTEELLHDLQKQVEEKQKHSIRLVDEIQNYKLDSLKTQHQMDRDRQAHERTLKMEKEADTLGQRKMEELQSKVEELQHQLQEKSLQVYNLDLEGKRLQGIMQEFQMQELEQEERQKNRRLIYQNINEQATWNFIDDRTRNWVLQQKMEEETNDTSYTKLIEMNGGNSIYKNDVGVIKQKLQHVALKLHHVAQKACNRLEFEVSDKDALIWVREKIDGIIFRLQRLTGQPDAEHSLGHFSTSCGSLTETLLKQIFELTGHINQLTEEKKDLQKIIMKLEEQIKFYQQTRAGSIESSGFSLDGGANIEDIIASEKEVWSKEKLTLQQSLKKAEAKVCELKAELLHQNQSPDSDNAVFKRLYGKYLRAESFRKALVFQKKYLLLLLGQFQECEDVTMVLLARMVGCTDFRNPETVTRSPKAFTRFRAAIRVSVAITRMKFLVRRWHRLKSSGPIIVNRYGFELSPGVEKTDQLYHSTSGLELYGEQRQMTYHSRSDLEIPRFPLPFNRYPGAAADLNPENLTYSPLQHYNPGRTLTDYVTQMEALQRRLGSKGSSPSFQSHPGMRK
ncbi:A-kinase anchor protein 9 isoform X3 [Sigmodon hispidus]